MRGPVLRLCDADWRSFDLGSLCAKGMSSEFWLKYNGETTLIFVLTRDMLLTKRRLEIKETIPDEL